VAFAALNWTDGASIISQREVIADVLSRATVAIDTLASHGAPQASGGRRGPGSGSTASVASAAVVEQVFRIRASVEPAPNTRHHTEEESRAHQRVMKNMAKHIARYEEIMNFTAFQRALIAEQQF